MLARVRFTLGEITEAQPAPNAGGSAGRVENPADALAFLREPVEQRDRLVRLLDVIRNPL